MYYLLLSDCRTGTQMLKSALGQHPEIRVSHEILNPSQKGFIFPEDLHQVFEEAFETYTMVHVHRYQLPLSRHFWDVAIGFFNPKIIDLRRINLLDQYRSYRLAIETKCWQQKAEELPQLTWDNHDFVRNASLWQQQRDWCDDYFAASDCLSITYESLCALYDLEIKRIQEFLGVNPLPLKPSFPRPTEVDYSKVFVPRS